MDLKRVFDFLTTLRRLASHVLQRLRGVPRIESGPGKGLRFDAGPASAPFLTGEVERPVQEAILSVVQKGHVFYDIGANVGFFSVLVGREVGPAGAVYAFEPVPANAARIERNALLNQLDNIHVLRLAVSSELGRSELLLAHHAGGAVLKGAGVPPDLAGSLFVETASIDALMESQGLRTPDIVKIDVEGAEINVLHGMVNMLLRCRPIMLIEVDDAESKACEIKLLSCLEFLSALDYTIDVLPNSYDDGRWFVRHLIGRYVIHEN